LILVDENKKAVHRNAPHLLTILTNQTKKALPALFSSMNNSIAKKSGTDIIMKYINWAKNLIINHGVEF
jgi:hypothetical protein